MRISTLACDAPATPALWPERVRRALSRVPLESRAHHVLCTAFVWLMVAGTGEAAAAQQANAGEPMSGEEVDASAPEEPAARQYVIVEGQVTDHVGAGHAGVTITVRRKTRTALEGELLGTATTDKLGDFRITAPEPIHGDVVVTLSKPLYTPIVRELHVGDGEWPAFLAERLEGTLEVVGRVTDALTDEPLADASVTLEASYNEWYATTDERGRFSIEGVVPGRGELIVEKKGYGRERQRVRQTEGCGDMTVRLKPERVVRVKTVDDLGKVIAGVTVECYDDPHDDFRTGVTDEAGSIVMRGIHFDAVSLVVRLTHDEYVSSQGFDREIRMPEQRTASTHELVLERAGKIAGQVTSSHPSEPLYGARLITGIDYSDDSPRSWTDYQGNYTIRGVRPGSTTVTVHLSGYAPELATVQVKAGETARLDVELRKGAVIEGIVKTESGKPVSGAFVDATHWRGAATLGLRAVTGDEGNFIIENAPHDPFEVSVTTGRVGPVTSMAQAGRDEPLVLTVPDAPVAIESDTRVILRVGDAAPPFSLTTLDGKPLTLGDFEGKIVLMHFWAVGCAPCVADIPYLIEVDRKYGKRKDFVMIDISLDLDEKVLRGFLEERKMSRHDVFGETGGARTAADRYGVRAIPTLLIIGSDGKIIATGLSGEEIVRKVEQILQDHNPP